MKKILLLSFLLCLSIISFSQVFGKKEFIYGTLTGEQRDYTGYFWFDNQVGQVGQRILFKTDLTAKKQTLYADDFDSFVSDSLHMETFIVPVLGVGKIPVMLPRIVSGNLELYNCIYAGYYSFVKTDHFFILNGGEKIRLKKSKFIEQMRYLVGTDFALMERIEKKEFQYNDLPQIIYIFNN